MSDNKKSRKSAPYTELGSIFYRLKSSAAEHGHKGILGIVKHTIK